MLPFPPGDALVARVDLKAAPAARGADLSGLTHTGDGFTPHVSLCGAGGPDVPVGRRRMVGHVGLLRTGGGRTTVVARRRLGCVEVTRENAWATLTRHTTSDSLLRHALAVDRDEVAQGAELLGIALDERIANVIEALQPISAELGLPSAD